MGRRKDRANNTKKSKLERDTGGSQGIKASKEPVVTWNSSRSAAEKVLCKDLEVTELKWPEERNRDSSQESRGIYEQQRLACSKAPPYKPVLGTSQTARHLDKSHKTCSARESLNSATELAECAITGPNFWPLLSDEIVLYIFKFLPKLSVVRCARVCKHWKRLAYDESLWRRADLSQAKLSPGVLGKVINRGTKVLRIAKAQVLPPLFDESQTTSFEGVVPLSAPESPNDGLLNLRFLDATQCTFEGDTLLCLLMHAKRLKCLSLESCNLSLGIMRAISACQGLEVLNLAMCTGITVPGLIALVKGCRRLKELNLAWTDLTKEGVKQVVSNFPELRQLNLSGCRSSATDADIEILLKKCPQLVYLDVSDCVLLTQRTLQTLIKHNKIEHLSMSRCYKVTPAFFSWCARMRNLTKLNVFGLLEADDIKVLTKELPNIAINACMFCAIARPTAKASSRKVWGMIC